MRLRSQLPLALIAVPFLLYAALKGYVYFQAKSGLDDLKARLAPYATLQYGEIGSTLWSGRVVVGQITLQPTGFTDIVRMDQVSIDAGNLPALLGSSWGADGPPEKLRVAVKGLAIDLSGPLMGALDRLLAQAAATKPGLTMTHCGGIVFMGPRQYRKLGYEQLVNDLNFGWVLDRRARQVRVDFDGATRDMGSFSGEMEMVGVQSSGKTDGAAQTRLASLRFSYRDQSYLNRVQRFCMEASGLNADEYIEAEINHLSATLYYTWGEGLGAGLRAAYRDFLTKPGELQFAMRPPGNFDMRTLALLTPGDILNRLDVTLTVNGNAVSDLSFDRNARPVPVKLPAVGDAPAEDLPPQLVGRAGSAPLAAAAAAESGYRAIPVAELGKHVGREVRVHVIGAATRDGVLAEVRPLEIVIERRYRGGSMAVKVPTNRIARVEAMF